MLLRARLRLAILLLLVASSGCTAASAEKSIPYATFSKAMFASSGGEDVVLGAAESIRLVVKSQQTGKAVEGARVYLGEREIVGKHGQFQVPLSRALVAQNPNLRVVPPPGHKGPLRVDFAFNLTFSKNCAEPETSFIRERVDLTRWSHVDVGPDRVYVEPPLTTADAQHLEVLLRESRAMLTDLTGSSPPPLAIALGREDAPVRNAERDQDQRTVWLTKPSESHRESFIGFITHEWTHLLLEELNFPRDQALRYVEDGLADLLAHLAERRQLKRAITPALMGRRAIFDAIKPAAAIDLYALSNAYKTQGSLTEIEAAMCQPGVADGYALGMAYWLGRTGARERDVRALFASMRRAMPKNASEVEALLSKTGQSPRAFSSDEARAWLFQEFADSDGAR